jgi:hypothetical protein
MTTTRFREFCVQWDSFVNPILDAKVRELIASGGALTVVFFK